MKFIGSALCILIDDIALNTSICSTGVTALSILRRSRVLSRINALYTAAPNVHMLTPFGSTTRSYYARLRTVSRKPLRILRSKLLAAAGGSCPFCGELLDPRTLDHFLPKEYFPEFAATSANLVPICDNCNRAKDTRVTNAAGARLFRHPYFDANLSTPLLFSQISWSGAVPTFSLEPIATLSGVLRGRLERHLSAIRCRERFAISAARLFRSWVRQQSTPHPYIGIELTRAIQYEIDRNEAEYGVNNWMSIALRAILIDAVAMASL